MTVDQSEAVLTRTTTGLIRLGGLPCGGATVFNTETIVITGGPSIDHLSLNGDYAPGRTPDSGRSEIEISLSSIEAFRMVLGDGDDSLVAHEAGLDVGDDRDIDITGGRPQIVNGGGGDDILDFADFPIGTMRGGGGNDALIGGDSLFGDGGDDLLIGTASPNRLDGGPGDDIQFGNEGNDTFVIGAAADGADRIEGGPGKDVVDYSQRVADVTVTSSTGGDDDGEIGEGDEISRVETILTGSGNDFVIGTNEVDAIDTGAGDDEVLAGGSSDTVETGPGNDTLDGGEGRNSLRAGDGDDVIISSSPSDDSISAGAGDDQIIGNADGGLDRVGCGDGFDTAEADPEDIFTGCELVQ